MVWKLYVMKCPRYHEIYGCVWKVNDKNLRKDLVKVLPSKIEIRTILTCFFHLVAKALLVKFNQLDLSFSQTIKVCDWWFHRNVICPASLLCRNLMLPLPFRIRSSFIILPYFCCLQQIRSSPSPVLRWRKSGMDGEVFLSWGRAGQGKAINLLGQAGSKTADQGTYCIYQYTASSEVSQMYSSFISMIVIMIIIIGKCCHIVSLWLSWIGKIWECHILRRSRRFKNRTTIQAIWPIWTILVYFWQNWFNWLNYWWWCIFSVYRWQK